MALTAEETALYTTRLMQAEESLHQLMMGQQARTFVDQNGERVEFSAGNTSKLRAYIYELKLKLGKVSPNGPLKVDMI